MWRKVDFRRQTKSHLSSCILTSIIVWEKREFMDRWASCTNSFIKDNTGPFGHVSYLSKIPGPSYEIPSTMIKKEAPSIKSRIRDNTIKNRNYVNVIFRKIPGPGTYEIPSVLDHGQNGTF